MSKIDVKPILPKTGQLMIEDTEEFVLCKPRLIPLKSYTLVKLEKMQKDAQQAVREENSTKDLANN